MLALINAAFIVAWSPERPLARTLLHHFYDAGQLLALGSIGAAVLVLVGRVRRSTRGKKLNSLQRALAIASTIALALALGHVFLADDLAGFTNRRAQQGSSLPWHWIGVSCMGVALASVVAVAVSLHRRRLVLLAIAAGVGLGVGNQLVLQQNYPGIHLYAALASATLLGAGVGGLRRPSGLPTLPRWSLPVALVTSSLGSLYTLLWLPDARTWRDVFVLPGAVVAPFVARLHTSSDEIRPSRRLSSPWYRSRQAAPSVSPSARGRLPPSPIVLFITADAVRGDLVDGDRYRTELPVLHALRDQSAYFTLARSPSPSTASTFAAIYMGKYYSGTLWSGRDESSLKRGQSIWPRSDHTPRVADLLTRAGVDTVNVRMLNAFSNATGISRGFSEHIKVGHYALAADGRRKLVQRLRKQGNRPLFMAMHWIDPHAPYTRGGAKGTRGSDFDRYLLEVAYVDSELGKLLKELDKAPFKDRTILIFASDHGEAFGEHGSRHHAGTMYEELLRVPLLVHGPGIEARRIDEPVSLIDLGPTLLDLFGEPTPGWFMGQSLVPFLLGEERDLTRPIAGEASRRMQSLVFPDEYKAIVDLRRNTEEVYDLRQDPHELNNLAETSERADEALNDLRLFFSAHQLENYTPPWREF